LAIVESTPNVCEGRIYGEILKHIEKKSGQKSRKAFQHAGKKLLYTWGGCYQVREHGEPKKSRVSSGKITVKGLPELGTRVS